MNDFLFLILPYTIAILLALGGYLLYLQFSSLRWDESEIRVLEHLELHLAHILRLLEAPDVKVLLENPQSRRRLFLEFSSYLREDVIDLLRSRKMDLTILPFVATFFLSYYGLRLKTWFSCSRNDLRFLSGLELWLFRRIERVGTD